MTTRLRPDQLDLNLLYTLHRVVVDGGVGAAARSLGRTQPAISLRLRQLEQLLGVKLLAKAGRGVALTAVGRAMAGQISELVDRVHGLLDTARAAAAEPVGVLRIGSLPTVSTYLLAAPLAALSRRYPRVEFDLRAGTIVPQLQALARGEIDAVVSVGRPVAMAGVRVHEVGHASAVAVLPVRARVRGRLTLARLRGLAIVDYGRTGDAFFDTVADFLSAHDLDRAVRLRMAHIQTLKQLVIAGAGVAFLPDYTVVEPGLRRLRVEGLSLRHPIWVGVRRASAELPVLTELVARLRADRTDAVSQS
ncbi:MAG: LysR family transcriptional regulator [Deltaproteobacteria bacterium]|nr:LysR family transcriptional regulator [Deltaproteobacteria bacterium]